MPISAACSCAGIWQPFRTLCCVRHPIFVSREWGVLVAEMLGGKENRNAGSYHREDCQRWANRYGISFRYPPHEVFAERAARWALSPFHREELPARAFYAVEPSKRDALDEALFAAAWTEGLDVNEPDTIRWAAAQAGADRDALLAAASAAQPGAEARAALDEFDTHACPGVPTVIVDGERFFGKDRVDWIIEACQGIVGIVRKAEQAHDQMSRDLSVPDIHAEPKWLHASCPRGVEIRSDDCLRLLARHDRDDFKRSSQTTPLQNPLLEKLRVVTSH
jgi:2-hydroxychromene-2-carboxylate isomerase